MIDYAVKKEHNDKHEAMRKYLKKVNKKHKHFYQARVDTMNLLEDLCDDNLSYLIKEKIDGYDYRCD